MSSNFIQSTLLREAYWAARRMGARFSAGAGPRVFLNSIPKAGTHLATVELAKMGVRAAGIHLKTRKINLAAPDNQPSLEFRADLAAFARQAHKVRPGQFLTGHLPWDGALPDYLRSSGFRSMIMVRDPRAVLVSQYHYVLGLRRHQLHEVLTSLPDELSRYRLLLRGSDSPVVHGVRLQLERFLPWVRNPEVLTLRFEDLVGESGGGSFDAKLRTLQEMSGFLSLGHEDLAALAGSSQQRTATLRKGRIDSWREELPGSILDELEEEIGDLYKYFGYQPRGTAGLQPCRGDGE